MCPLGKQRVRGTLLPGSVLGEDLPRTGWDRAPPSSRAGWEASGSSTCQECPWAQEAQGGVPESSRCCGWRKQAVPGRGPGTAATRAWRDVACAWALSLSVRGTRACAGHVASMVSAPRDTARLLSQPGDDSFLVGPPFLRLPGGILVSLVSASWPLLPPEAPSCVQRP